MSKEGKLAVLPHFVVIDDKEFDNIPGYTKRVPSKKKIILVGIILIILVVFALNSWLKAKNELGETQEEIIERIDMEIDANGTF